MSRKHHGGKRKRALAKRVEREPIAGDQRESGNPGGGRGRRDEIGKSGVYAASSDNIPGDAEVRMAGSWGGGDYNESGRSELVWRDGQLLGGFSSEPTERGTGDGRRGTGDATRRKERR